MENKRKILDIAMNLTRIGNWAADDYEGKHRRLSLFMDQTLNYINDINTVNLPFSVRKPLLLVPQLLKQGRKKPKDTLAWAEKMMTWGNILTHRAVLLRDHS